MCTPWWRVEKDGGDGRFIVRFTSAGRRGVWGYAGMALVLLLFLGMTHSVHLWFSVFAVLFLPNVILTFLIEIPKTLWTSKPPAHFMFMNTWEGKRLRMLVGLTNAARMFIIMHICGMLGLLFQLFYHPLPASALSIGPLIILLLTGAILPLVVAYFSHVRGRFVWNDPRQM